MNEDDRSQIKCFHPPFHFVNILFYFRAIIAFTQDKERMANQTKEKERKKDIRECHFRCECVLLFSYTHKNAAGSE